VRAVFAGPVKTVLVCAAVCAALVVFCNLFVDRPVALFTNAHAGVKPLFQLMASPSLLPLPLAAVVLGVAVWARLQGGAAPSRLFLTLSLATLVATGAKDELKWMFGRPWPSSWINAGIYTFHPFTNNYLYGSFPSGHTAYITAPMVVLWALAPRYRALWGGIVGMVMLGLVGADYHFVGDVIAGFFTGLAAAAGTLVLLRDA
jgi:membrane-associated phospholipid phosphatase